MLNEKMREVLSHAKDAYGVKSQAELAMRLGMSLERLKNMLSGRIQKLTADEMRSAEQALGVRRAWWTTEAPMLLTAGEKLATPSMASMEQATQEVVGLGLDGWHANTVQELLFNVRGGRAQAVIDQLEALRAPPGRPTDEQRLSTCIQFVADEAEAAGAVLAPNALGAIVAVIYGLGGAPDRQNARVAIRAYLAAGGATAGRPQ